MPSRAFFDDPLLIVEALRAEGRVFFGVVDIVAILPVAVGVVEVEITGEVTEPLLCRKLTLCLGKSCRSNVLLRI